MNSAYNFNMHIKESCSQRPHFQAPLSGLYIQIWLYNPQIIEKDKLDTSNTHIHDKKVKHDRPFSFLGTDTSLKSDRVK